MKMYEVWIMQDNGFEKLWGEYYFKFEAVFMMILLMLKYEYAYIDEHFEY